MPKKVSLGRKLTPRQRRDLDIEIGFMEGVVQRDPRFVEALQILGDDYTRRGKFDAGLRVDERLARLRPHDPTMLVQSTSNRDTSLRALAECRSARAAFLSTFSGQTR